VKEFCELCAVMPPQRLANLQAAVCRFFRESMLQQGFQEIHTPKLIGGSSEGGSEARTGTLPGVVVAELYVLLCTAGSSCHCSCHFMGMASCSLTVQVTCNASPTSNGTLGA
jgi:hypothetical protein